MGLFARLLRRKRVTPPPPPPRAAMRPPPPPPPPTRAAVPPPPPEDEGADDSPAGPKVKLILADGSAVSARNDPKTTAQLEYLARNLVAADEDASSVGPQSKPDNH